MCAKLSNRLAALSSQFAFWTVITTCNGVVHITSASFGGTPAVIHVFWKNFSEV
jgi:hypothetical protein